MLRLKFARLERGYTQEKLSEITGISLRNIRSYEGGYSNPPLEKLCLLAKKLNVTIDYLLEMDKKDNNGNLI